MDEANTRERLKDVENEIAEQKALIEAALEGERFHEIEKARKLELGEDASEHFTPIMLAQKQRTEAHAEIAKLELEREDLELKLAAGREIE